MDEQKTTPLRFLIFGAGAIGTYIGGSLALVGRPVVFLERPDIAGELRQRGLRLQIGGEERRIEHPRIASSLNEALTMGPFDVAVFALKAYDTRQAVEGLVEYQAALPAFLCLQNGVENESILAGVLGEDRVIAGTVTSAVGRRAAGDIVLERFRGMGITRSNPVVTAMFSALLAAGLNPKIYLDAASLKWSKMLTNLMVNASVAILDMPPQAVLAHPGMFRLEISTLREALAVMKAMSLRVVLSMAAMWSASKACRMPSVYAVNPTPMPKALSPTV